VLKEFKAFVMRGNAVDLAVGIVIGAAFTSVVQGVVSGLINPLVGLFGDSRLEQLSFSIGTRMVDGAPEPNTFTYGAVLDGVLNFLIVAATVFFLVVKPMNAMTARMRRGEETPEPTTRPCPECLSEIPKKARRCSHCTAEVGAAA